MDGEIYLPLVRALLAAVWLGVAPLSLAFVCWDRAVSSPYIGLVGRLSFFDALLSTMFLALFLREWPTGAVWIGMALITFGVTMPELFMWGQSRTESSVSQLKNRQIVGINPQLLGVDLLAINYPFRDVDGPFYQAAISTV
jgi:hypothetical protein